MEEKEEKKIGPQPYQTDLVLMRPAGVGEEQCPLIRSGGFSFGGKKWRNARFLSLR